MTGKFERRLTWVKNTIYDQCVIGERKLSEVFTWIYLDYDVNVNMIIHMSGAMSMGYIIIHVKVLKHKMNVKSLEEIELVGFSEYISYNI